jgi:hypothetical protein
VGRFISPDTLVPDPTDPQDLNRYSYAKNNPMRYNDPTGHCADPVTAVFCVVAGGAVVVMGGATVATQPTPSAPAVDVAALAAPITQPMDEAALVLQVGGEMARPYLAQQGMDLAAQSTGLIAQGLVWYAEATGETQLDGGVPNGQTAGDTSSEHFGGNNAAAQRGKQAHKDFKQKVQAKPGWQSEPQNLVDPKTGRKVIPDALSPSGRPVELKPNTPRGHRQGKSQLKKYERATGKRGRVIYYD